MDTGYLDLKLATFNLEVLTDIEKEEEKMQRIATLIQAIKENRIKVRQ